jgi:hypothetical protein
MPLGSSERAINERGRNDLDDLRPPPAEDAIDWPAILGVERDWPLAAIEAVWKTKVEKAHPDRGGDPAVMASINAAMDAARKDRPNA